MIRVVRLDIALINSEETLAILYFQVKSLKNETHPPIRERIEVFVTT